MGIHFNSHGNSELSIRDSAYLLALNERFEGWNQHCVIMNNHNIFQVNTVHVLNSVSQQALC